MNSIWFMNEQHEQNYNDLSVRFPNVLESNEYKAACYLAAVPDVFRRFKISELTHGPFDWFFDEIEEGSSRIYNLKDFVANYYIVQAGASFWNGYRGFQLNNAISTWTDEYYKAFSQACELYRNRA